MNRRANPGGPATPPHRERLSITVVTLSVFLMCAGGVFALPFVLSPNAIQNDVYMSNLFLAPLLTAAGLALLIVGSALFRRSAPRQARVRGPWARTLLLALAGAGIVTAASFLVGGRYESYPPGSVYWPPYLNGWLLAVTAAVGVGVTVTAWRWAAREPDGAHEGAV